MIHAKRVTKTHKTNLFVLPQKSRQEAKIYRLWKKFKKFYILGPKWLENEALKAKKCGAKDSLVQVF